MSDSEASDFRVDDGGSDSDGYAPATKVKKPPAAKKAAAPKKAAPKKAAPKKAPLGAKKNLPNDSGSESDGETSRGSTPAKRKLSDTDVDAAPAKPAAKKSASEMYQKLSQLEHILKRPDTYIGSVEAHTQKMWVFNPKDKQMEFREITYVPGFFKIFDEILVNAADNKINDPTMDTIKVSIDREKSQISVYNNGKGIPVEMHAKEKIMIPELIFGNLLTSSNYDDDQKKLTGGRNGYGAKLANIYSHEFIVETADKVNGKKYKQVFSENMSKKGTPKITENKKGEEWTKISFTPDLKRFGMDGIDDDTYALLMKRVYDIAGTVKDIKVHLDDERLKIKGFKNYVDMYVAAAHAQAVAKAGGAAIPKPHVAYEPVGSRWEVAFALSDGEFNQVSFANSISTIKGGTHVDMLASQLATKLLDGVKKKNKAAPIKPSQVKSHMWIFVNALVENPSFDSQTKETLTLKASAFGSKCDLSDNFVKSVNKTGIVENVLNWAKFKQDQLLKKTDGAKRSRVGGISKLEDANWAGGRRGKDCTLILTEGDSAKALAVSGIGAIQGRDQFGVFPLRGKLLNVREASHDQIMKNAEIQAIKQILGLKHNHVYTSVDSLRYGQLMIMTDQDHDGSHIKGLIINFLDHFYPSLLRIPNFLVEFITPIIKLTKGKKGTPTQKKLVFYTMPQYEQWREENNDGKGWDAKYLKGLGTSESVDGALYFDDLPKHRLAFDTVSDEERGLIDMAFNKKKADDRKEWLRQFKPGTFLDQDVNPIPMPDFINKELILFSMADNIRSIPSVADGLKPGQRKVIFGCFKRNLTKEIKVGQLSGYISENTAYHHGEVSLQSTIVGLAQNFVGSNNINLLAPIGQFGTRMSGGKDAASARYIFTELPRMTRALLHKDDDDILNYQIEDGQRIEPVYYLPIIPMVLVNGADGIGTGWSTSIPNYNPEDIVANLRRMMRGEDIVPMTPWFRGFNGDIERIDGDKFKVSGKFEKIDDKTLEITELPIRKWTSDFKEFIEAQTSGGKDTATIIKDYEEHHTDRTVHFKLHLKDGAMKTIEAEGIEKRFKLSTTITTSNMVCFDLDGKIKKYSSAEEIIADFYPKRLEYYSLRKQHLADQLQKQFDRLTNQARFVNMIIKKELSVSNKKKANLVAELRKLDFQPFPKGTKRPDGESEAALEEEEQGADSDFDYLLGMAIWSLTAEKVEKLLAEKGQKEAELQALLNLSPLNIWNTDLDNFLVEWKKMLEEDQEVEKQMKGKSKGQRTKASNARKRAKGDDSGSEDDFKPTVKKATKPRAPAKTRVKAESASVSAVTSENPSVSGSSVPSPIKLENFSDSDGETPVPKKPAGRPRTKKITTVDIDSDDDDDMYYAESKATSKPTSSVSSASTVKPKIEETTTTSATPDSDDDFLNKFLPTKSKAAPKAKAATKKKTPANSDDEMSAPTPKAKAKAAPKTAAKRKASVVDSDDEVLSKPKAKAKAAPKTAAKKAAKVEPESDDELDVIPKKKAAPKKAAKGKAKDNSDFEGNSDEEVEYAPPARASTARTARGTAKKPVYVDLSDMDESD